MLFHEKFEKELEALIASYDSSKLAFLLELISKTNEFELLVKVIDSINESFSVEDILCVIEQICDQLGILYSQTINEVLEECKRSGSVNKNVFLISKYLLEVFQKLPSQLPRKCGMEEKADDWIQVSDRRYPQYFVQIFEEYLRKHTASKQHVSEISQRSFCPASFFQAFSVKSPDDFDIVDDQPYFECIKPTDSICSLLFDWLVLEDENVVDWWIIHIQNIVPITNSQFFVFFY